MTKQLEALGSYYLVTGTQSDIDPDDKCLLCRVKGHDHLTCPWYTIKKRIILRLNKQTGGVGDGSN